MAELITTEEEEKLHEKLISYYQKLYPAVRFRKQNTLLTHEQIGEIYYTHPGEESEATFSEKVKEIASAYKLGYLTPVILLKKDNRLILIDGHRRLKVAWDLDIEWPALLIVPDKEIKLGIEKIITGHIKDMWKVVK